MLTKKMTEEQKQQIDTRCTKYRVEMERDKNGAFGIFRGQERSATRNENCFRNLHQAIFFNTLTSRNTSFQQQMPQMML